MKTKGVSYDLENDLMFLKCLGSYRVWVFTGRPQKMFNKILKSETCSRHSLRY